jgi:heme-degrading monooxygenase HmoA
MSVIRLWRGAVARERADEYVAYLHETGLRDYAATPGNRGALLLRRDEGDLTRITTLSVWDGLDDVRAFAGEHVERARFYPEDDRFLVEREETVEHWTVAGGEL